MSSQPVTTLPQLRPAPQTEPPPVHEPLSAHLVRRTAYIQQELGVDFDPDFGPRATSSKDLPPVDNFVPHLTHALVEVLGGQRPATQLARYLTPALQTRLTRGSLARFRRATALTKVRVRRIRVCSPTDGAAEIAVTVQWGARVRALAMRMEGIDGRWIITALELA